ncbi:MAG TPA: PadR family transcriptional regulator [Ilumatobacteraceae bacterium]|nr:PadR family transcriptional regulator [Ilumatobacteraceae bacterium]
MDPRSGEHEDAHEHGGQFGRPFGARRGGRRTRGFGFGPDGPPRRGPRRGRGDVRTATLLLLLERPMHGYEMIQEIRERSGEAWSPSPGAIYPTIQLLTDEGLITTTDEDGKKVSRLTDAGRAIAEELASTTTAPWDAASTDAGEGAPNLRHAIHHLLMAVKQVAMAGTTAQRQRATELLDETRRKIYALLASDES